MYSSLLFLLFPPSSSSSSLATFLSFNFVFVPLLFYHAIKLRFRVAGTDKTRVRYYLVFIVLVKSICARRCAFAYVPTGNPEYIEQLGGGVTSEITSKSRVCRVRCSFWRLAKRTYAYCLYATKLLRKIIEQTDFSRCIQYLSPTQFFIYR